ncbi:hypothetical protein C8Q75DRAFT_740074 [Abortiporus biennis]|nr:hypothetical protein C8Q75DRAFT_740074 [Abortiporus biennis]
MTSHYRNFLEGIKESYIEKDGMLDLQRRYENMQFRDPGLCRMTYETPHGFVHSRVLLGRTILPEDVNEIEEVTSVIQGFPSFWLVQFKWNYHPSVAHLLRTVGMRAQALGSPSTQ